MTINHNMVLLMCLCAVAVACAVTVVVLLKRQRVQKRLLKENVHLTQMLNAINESNVWVVFDKSEELTSVSSAFCRLYGFTFDTYIQKVGKTLTDYLKWSGEQHYSRNGGISFVGKSEGRRGLKVWKQVNVNK